ncbi:hypothetical protein [uncultured Anaerofustis sp.]|uniref:hypothetical protein n=1 Tax=uncultured Anaerofustis sp. TaxID=904996 RepID=UPI0025E33083|nr:hypothetical protein [uncultured Anaerofustis sp.]
METYKTTIEWHDVKKELPNKSGNYLCYIDKNNITELPYSYVYKKFNARDFYENKHVLLTEINIKYWAEIPILEMLEVNDDK